jgi:hypothetical protein
MAEVIRTRIRSFFGDLKGLMQVISGNEHEASVDNFVVTQINQVIDDLTQLSETDYSSYKIPTRYLSRIYPNAYEKDLVMSQLGRIIGRLGEEQGFDKPSQSDTPNIVILNENQNKVSVTIDYTIENLIEQSEDTEVKENLGQIATEVKSANPNWEKIKTALGWILNFSKDLFLKVIPIILEKRL